MPAAPARPCAGSCGQVGIWSGPRCPACAQARDRQRGTSTQRGYDSRNWGHFRRQFLAMLVAAGIPPVCGATLPGGPVTQDSACKAAGLQVFDNDDGTGLHLDHEPPLTEAERLDPAAVCDPLRIQCLCRADHARKTRREAQA